MSEDYLYPARPGMLRRGTPVYAGHGSADAVCLTSPEPDDVGSPGVMVSVDPMSSGDTTYCMWIGHLSLDLRDVTARAHAAMVYTELCNQFGSLMFSSLIPASAYLDSGGWMLPTAREVLNMLARMRSMDESVTVAEARSALDWAYAASGGER